MGNDDIKTYSPHSSQKKREEYKESDVEEIFKTAHPRSWKEIVNFIEKKGDEQWHVTPGEAKSMKDDFEQLAEKEEPFTDNPREAYHLAHHGA